MKNTYLVQSNNKIDKSGVVSHFCMSLSSLDWIKDSWVPESVLITLLLYQASCGLWKTPWCIHERIQVQKAKSFVALLWKWFWLHRLPERVSETPKGPRSHVDNDCASKILWIYPSWEILREGRLCDLTKITEKVKKQQQNLNCVGFCCFFNFWMSTFHMRLYVSMFLPNLNCSCVMSTIVKSVEFSWPNIQLTCAEAQAPIPPHPITTERGQMCKDPPMACAISFQEHMTSQRVV